MFIAKNKNNDFSCFLEHAICVSKGFDFPTLTYHGVTFLLYKFDPPQNKFQIIFNFYFIFTKFSYQQKDNVKIKFTFESYDRVRILTLICY